MSTRCWDHITQTPFKPIGSRYGPLKPPTATFTFEGIELPQWQYEIDNAARVKVALGKEGLRHGRIPYALEPPRNGVFPVLAIIRRYRQAYQGSEACVVMSAPSVLRC